MPRFWVVAKERERGINNHTERQSVLTSSIVTLGLDNVLKEREREKERERTRER